MMSVGKDPPPKNEKVFRVSLLLGIKSLIFIVGNCVFKGCFF